MLRHHVDTNALWARGAALGRDGGRIRDGDDFMVFVASDSCMCKVDHFHGTITALTRAGPTTTSTVNLMDESCAFAIDMIRRMRAPATSRRLTVTSLIEVQRRWRRERLRRTTETQTPRAWQWSDVGGMAVADLLVYQLAIAQELRELFQHRRP